MYHFQAIKNYVKFTTTQHSNGVLVNVSLQQVLQNMLRVRYKISFIKINRAEAIAKSIIIKVDNNLI